MVTIKVLKALCLFFKLEFSLKIKQWQQIAGPCMRCFYLCLNLPCGKCLIYFASACITITPAMLTDRQDDTVLHIRQDGTIV